MPSPSAQRDLPQRLQALVLQLAALPCGGQIRVFGSLATGVRHDPLIPGAVEPSDIDCFVDLRPLTLSEQHLTEYRSLLGLARRHYGWIDPFLVFAGQLLVRNAEATGWIPAKHARALVRAMERDGVPLASLLTARPDPQPLAVQSAVEVDGPRM